MGGSRIITEIQTPGRLARQDQKSVLQESSGYYSHIQLLLSWFPVGQHFFATESVLWKSEFVIY